MRIRVLAWLKMRAWYEYEEDAERNCNDGRERQRHSCAFSEQGSHVRLADFGPVQERVFAQSGKRGDRVNLVLVRREEVGAEREWQDNL